MAHTTIHYRHTYREVHETDALGVVAIARVVVEAGGLDPTMASHARHCVQRWLDESTGCGLGCFRFFLDELGEDAEKMHALRTLLERTDAQVASYGERIPAPILNAALPLPDGYFGNVPVSGVRRVLSDLFFVLDAPSGLTSG